MASSMSIGDAIRKCCMPSWNGKSLNQHPDNIKNGNGFKQELFNNELGSKHPTSGQEKFKGSLNIYVYEKNDLKTRLIEAAGEINAKKITIISLRDRLCSAEALLIKSKNRESYYKNQLENGSREFKRLKFEKEQAQGLADHHREQQLQAEEEFKLLLKTQRQHIQMLHEHLANEELMVKQREYDRHEILEIEHKIKYLQKELEIERRLKNEAKKDREDIQAELDDMLTEIDGLRFKLKQSKQENERLIGEHKDEIAEYKSINGKELREELEMRVLEAQNIAHHKFDKERYALVKEIENYHKKCKELEVEKHKCAGQLQQTQAELESVRAADGSYKQHNIGKLKQETESLKTDLGIMTAKLDSLETENQALVASVNLKDGELRRAQQWKGRAKQLKLFEGKCKDILDKDENIQELENRPEQVIDGESLELRDDATFELQEEVIIEFDREAAAILQGSTTSNVFSATASAENIRLNEKLQAIENETFMRDSKIADLEARNRVLSETLKTKEDGGPEGLKDLQEELSRERETLRRNSQEWTGLVEKFDAERHTWKEKLDKLREENQALHISCEKYDQTIQQNKVEIESLRKNVSHEVEDRAMLLGELQKSIKCEVENLTSKTSNRRSDLKEKDALVDDMQGQRFTIVNLQGDKATLERTVNEPREGKGETDTKMEYGKHMNDLLKLNQQLEELTGCNEELKARNNEQIREIKGLKDRLRWQDSGTQVEELEKELQIVNKKMAKMANKEGELRIINEQQKIVVQEVKENLLEVEQDLKMKEELFKDEMLKLNRQKDWMKTRKEKLTAENSELQDQLNEQQRKTNESKLEAQEVYSKIKAAQFELAACESNKKTLEKRCQRLKKQLADKEIECKNFETNYNELLKELANQEKKYRQLDRDSAMEANIDESESAKRQFDRKVFEHEARLTEREAQLDKSEAKLEECEIALAKSEEKRREIEKDLKYLRKLFNKWTIDFDEMKAENSGLKKELKRYMKYSGFGKYNEETFEISLENENSNDEVALENVEENGSESNEMKKKMEEVNELQNEMKKQIRLLNSELDCLKEDFEKAEIKIHLNGRKDDFQQAVIDIHLNSLKKDFEEQEMEIHIKIKTQEDEREVVKIQSNHWEGLKAIAEQKDFEIRGKHVLGKLDEKKETKNVRVSAVMIDSTMRESESKIVEMEKENYGHNQQKDVFETNALEINGNDARKVAKDFEMKTRDLKTGFVTECEEPTNSEVSQAEDEHSKDNNEKSNAYRIIERDVADSSSVTGKVTATEAGKKENQRYRDKTADSRSDSDEDFWGMEFNEGPRNITHVNDKIPCKDFEDFRPSENVIHMKGTVVEDNVRNESEWTNIAEVCAGRGSRETTIADNFVGKEPGAAMTGEYYGGEDSGKAKTSEYYDGEDSRENTTENNYVFKEAPLTDPENRGGMKSKQDTKSILHTVGFKISRSSEKKKVGFNDKVDVHYFEDDDFYGTWNRTPLLNGFEEKWNIHIDINGSEEDDVTEDKTKDIVEIHGSDKSREKESSKVETKNAWLDDEEDMLSNFISTQKEAQNSASNPSTPDRVADVDASVDIKDVVAGIEECRESGDELDKNGAKVENEVERNDGDSERQVSCRAEEELKADVGEKDEDNVTEDITVSEINMVDFDYYETVEPTEEGSTETNEETISKQGDAQDTKQTSSTAEATEGNDITVEKALMKLENHDSQTDPEPVSSSLSLSSLLRPAFEVARNSVLPPLAPRKGALPSLDSKKMNI